MYMCRQGLYFDVSLGNSCYGVSVDSLFLVSSLCADFSE